ncbi:hypothetical protein D3C83_215660 [compost metagenome]
MARRVALKPYTSESTSPITYVIGNTMKPPSVISDQSPMIGPKAMPFVADTFEISTNPVKIATSAG